MFSLSYHSTLMLHSLNSIRVFAEFWVVHLHLSPTPPGMIFFVTRDFMSFFFVLSGFVMTHTHLDDDMSTWQSKRDFWWKRFSKMYPIFVLFWAVSLVFYTTSPEFQIKDTLCHYLQLVMASTWMGCRVNLMNQPSWYITVLWWLWFAFPWLLPLVRTYSFRWSWVQILVVNVVAMAIITPMFPNGYWGYATLPVFRMPEFIIGCITACTINTRIHWVWPSAAVSVMCVFYLNQYYLIRKTPPCDQGGYDTECITCSTSWSFATSSNPFSDPCLLVWSYAYCNKFSMLYAVIIHWLAASELGNVPNRYFRFLETTPFLQTLSTFSLQLYLGHSPIHKIVIQICGWVGFETHWELNLVFLIVYSTAYAVNVHIQPYLNASIDALGRCCMIKASNKGKSGEGKSEEGKSEGEKSEGENNEGGGSEGKNDTYP